MYSFFCMRSIFFFLSFFVHEMRKKSHREGVFAYNCIWYYIVYPINNCYISYNVYFIFKKLCYIFKTEQVFLDYCEKGTVCEGTIFVYI